MDENLVSILQIITTLVCLGIIPWMITVERRLSTLIAMNKNGLSKQVENLQEEIKDQRKEYGKRIHKLEIELASRGNSGSGIHSST